MNSKVSMLTRRAVLQRIDACQSFTALDIRNDLKAILDNVRYQDVADGIREMFVSCEMEPLEYTRCLIEVTTDGGTVVQSFLYLHISQYHEQVAISGELGKINAKRGVDICRPDGASKVDTSSVQAKRGLRHVA